MMIASSDDVLTFWREAGPDKWFKKDVAFDDAIRSRFLETYEAAAAGKLSDWEQTPDGAYALILVLDQFPRNMFRNDARTFAADKQAKAVAERAIAHGFNQKFDAQEKNFFNLPFTHSEDLADQERCVELARAAGDADNLKWAELHADTIRRFGRFPHRNKVLGRATKPEEQAFLDGGGFAG
jgi:uncharacterized protein (DUF924 family)